MSETDYSPEGHPDLAELDAFRTGEASPEARNHIDACELCGEIVGELANLAGELETAARPEPVHVPAEIDARVLAAARTRRPVHFRWPGLVAAAAAVLIAVGVFWGVRERRPALAMDIDGSGTVDIVDAYLLSRRIRGREAAPPAWDLDGDGNVGEGDVKLLARRAVALAGEGI